MLKNKTIRQNQAKETKNCLNFSDLSKNKPYFSGELLKSKTTLLAISETPQTELERRHV